MKVYRKRRAVFIGTALLLFSVPAGAAAQQSEQQSVEQQKREETSVGDRARMRGQQDRQQAEEQYQLLRDSTAAYRKIISDDPQGEQRKEIVSQASCVAIFPEVREGALVVGAKRSKGVVSCKTEEGEWSAPSFFRLTGASVGLQAGLEKTGLVLAFRDQEAKEKLKGGNVALGRDLTVDFGVKEAGVGTEPADVTAFSSKKGGKLGLSAGTTKIKVDEKALHAYYTEQMSNREVLSTPHGKARSDISSALIELISS